MKAQINVIPAYGRTYNSHEAAEKDWNDNKDFQIISIFPPQKAGGTYINKSDFHCYCKPGDTIFIRHEHGLYKALDKIERKKLEKRT